MLKISWASLCFFFFLFIERGSSQIVPSRLINSTLENYDKRFRPNYGGAPTEVAIEMYITSLDVKNSLTPGMTLELMFYWRHIWIDPRLKFNPRLHGVDEIQIGRDGANSIWVPDTFCVNAKSGQLQDLTVPNSFIRIRSDGEVLYSARYSAEVKCPADFYYFPFDKQVCSMEMESYGYGTQEVTYRWTAGQSLGLSPNISPTLFTIASYKAITQTQTIITGNFTRLTAEIVLERSATTYYFYRVYFPLGFLVFASWASLWINWHINGHGNGNGHTHINQIPIIMTGIIFASIVILCMGIHTILLPHVNYCTSLDVYLIGSVFFSFINFGITILVSYWNCFFTCKDESEIKDEKEEINGISKLAIHVFRISILVFYLISILIYCVTVGP